MSNVVQFLEALARSPKAMTEEDFVTSVVNAELDPGSKQALLERNTDSLNELLGGRAKMICMIAPAENDEPQREEEQESEEDAPEREQSRAA